MEESFSALKTIFSLTSLRFRKSNCKLGLFDNTAGDQKSGLPPEEAFSFFPIGLLNVPEGNILLNMA